MHRKMFDDVNHLDNIVGEEVRKYDITFGKN